MRNAVNLPELTDPGADYSAAIVSDGLVFVSGQAALDPETHALLGGDIVAQTIGTIHNIERVLAAAGCTLDDIVKVNAYLADIGDFDLFSQTYSRLLAEPRPARTTVGAGLTGILVEIACIARVPALRRNSVA